MRRRLLNAIMGVAIGAVLVLGIPFGIAGTAATEAHARQKREQVTEAVLAAVAGDLESGQTETEDRLASLLPVGYGGQLDAFDGTVVVVGARPRSAPDDTIIGASTLEVWSEASTTPTIVAVWALVAGAGAAGLAVAWVIGSLLSRRLSRPLAQLEVVATHIGAGDLTARAVPSDIAEIDHIGRALNSSAAQLSRLIAREREFSANVAHQLRTPLTGLLLRLDSAAQSGDQDEMRHDLAAAATQAERLSDIIEQLLQVASTDRRPATTVIELTGAVRAHLGEWQGRFDAAHRPLHLAVSPAANPAAGTDASPDASSTASPAANPVLLVAAADGVLEQVLDVVLDNALTHGQGGVQVGIVPRGATAVVRLADEGSGIDGASARRIFQRGWSRSGGPGLGLEVARALLERSGGRLELASTRPTTFEIYLPRPVEPAGHSSMMGVSSEVHHLQREASTATNSLQRSHSRWP